jgi:heme A synthase
LRGYADVPAFRRPAILLLVLVLGQIVLGAFTIWTGKGVLPTTFHVLNGAVILAASLVLTLRVRARVLPASVPAPRWQVMTPKEVGS